MKAFRFVLLALACTLASAVLVHAQTYARPPSMLWSIPEQQAVGGTGNKKKITLRVWHERIQHGDGTFSWYLNYAVEARDKNFWGKWKQVGALFNITYDITLTIGTTGMTFTRTGAKALGSQPTSEGILIDGGVGDPSLLPLITSATVTATRTGGTSGISVTSTH